MATNPILFNTEMGQAIMDGRKTVTRRLLKQPFEVYPNGYITKPKGNERLCPYVPPYQKGDYLYVRETWRVGTAHRYDADAIIEYRAGGDRLTIRFPFGNTDSTNRDEYDMFIKKWYPNGNWHPSIHMPKKVARIFLRVEDVKVERLCEISGEDLLKEGIDKKMLFDGPVSRAFNNFIEIWNSTIKPEELDKYGWHANPWVWVIEFEKAEVGK